MKFLNSFYSYLTLIPWIIFAIVVVSYLNLRYFFTGKDVDDEGIISE